MKIEKIIGREILDSRGIPTIECDLHLEDGSYVTASVPSGVSKSIQEAVEIRDGGSRIMGLGVTNAIQNLEHIIAPYLVGKEPELIIMDTLMCEIDGTINKSKLGGNAILAASIAILRAQAQMESLHDYELIAHLCGFESIALPLPMFTMINGGAHAHNNLRMQEFMIIPIDMASFRLAIEAAQLVFSELHNILLENNKFIGIGQLGGFTANFVNDIEALDYLTLAINQVQKKTNISFVITIDAAASHFYDQKTQCYNWHGKQKNSDQMIEVYKMISDNYPIYAIEDAMSECDRNGWQQVTKTLGGKIQLAGDDLFATNAERIYHGLQESLATSVVIKPNQIGTVTETLQTIKLCKENNVPITISHRSGETDDVFIADLSVAVSATHIKAGGLCRGERVAKYNQLLRIEDELMLSMLNM